MKGIRILLNKDTISNYIGIDVGKKDMVAFVNKDKTNCLKGNIIKFKNTPESVNWFIDKLNKDEDITEDNTLILIDLTGGYEVLARDILYNNGYKNIILAQGRKVKNFQRSTKNYEAKTDEMDSRTLVNYGINNVDKLELYNPLTNNRELIKNLFARILELKEIKRKEKTRYNSPIQNHNIKQSIENMISLLEKEIKDLETEINEIIKQDEELNLIYNTLTNIKGIKDKTAHTLIASLPELGRTNRK